MTLKRWCMTRTERGNRKRRGGVGNVTGPRIYVKFVFFFFTKAVLTLNGKTIPR